MGGLRWAGSGQSVLAGGDGGPAKHFPSRTWRSTRFVKKIQGGAEHHEQRRRGKDHPRQKRRGSAAVKVKVLKMLCAACVCLYVLQALSNAGFTPVWQTPGYGGFPESGRDDVALV